ncbi:UNVERIFIED_CONTAM: hypothetical protein GTU68_002316 [Idotea baltica]|nr:hypothetical protein [Idotea baltica]
MTTFAPLHLIVCVLL